ncbi:MAG: hypothetical protein ACLRFI_01325 [Alphaproteobacteria bacterium]
METSEQIAQSRLNDLGMGDMPIINYTPIPTKIPDDWFLQYKNLTHDFMQSLTECGTELAFMSLSETEFMNLITGKSLPTNTSIRLKIPLYWGGQLDIDNMFLCSTFPHSQNLDRFIIEQKNNKNIWLPNPATKIYIPIHSISSGTGGNATADRLAQMAAQIKSSNTMA